VFRSQAFRRFSGVLAAVLTVGCYEYEPVQGPTPAVGTEIAFDINDAGRVALGGSMGPEISQIEGRLVEKGAADYLVAVSSVHMLRGGEQVWAKEPVRIKSEYVSSVYEKKFSAIKSVALGAIGVGIVAAIAGRSLVGGGSTDQGGKQAGDTAQSTRRRP
jgi:hypothetical protein